MHVVLLCFLQFLLSCTAGQLYLENLRTVTIDGRVHKFEVFHRTANNYEEARQICIESGGQLPHPNEVKRFYKILKQENISSYSRLNKSIPNLTFYLYDQVEATFDSAEMHKGEKICFVIKKNLTREGIELASKDPRNTCLLGVNLVVCRTPIKGVQQSPRLIDLKSGHFTGVCIDLPIIIFLSVSIAVLLILLISYIIIKVQRYRKLKTEFGVASGQGDPGSSINLLSAQDKGDIVCNPVGQIISFSRQGSSVLKRTNIQGIPPNKSLKQELTTLSKLQPDSVIRSSMKNKNVDRSTNFL